MAAPSSTPPGTNPDSISWKASTEPSGFAGNNPGSAQNSVAGPAQQALAPRGYPSGPTAAGSGKAGNPGLEDPDEEGQRRRLQLYGSGGGGSGSGGSPLPTMATALSALEKPDKPRRPTVTPSVARRFGNRDFTIVLECMADAVLVQPWGTRFPVAALPDKAGRDVALVRAVQQRIAQRQASVQPGEPPYRPLIRFKIHPEGLRAYYQAYPLLVPLGIPMLRESVEDSRN
jgi:hypothetical protein